MNMQTGLKQQIMTINKLDIQDTLFLKGLAICGMLMWHIAKCPNSQGIEYAPIYRYLGSLGDVCVSVFLFISGYGLTIGYQKKGETNPIGFICNRLKLYSNYWSVFVPIVLFGTLVMHQPLCAEGSSLNIFLQSAKDFFAIRRQNSYNDSWWYFSLIISLYLVYPILYWGLKKVPYVLFIISLISGPYFIRFIDQSLQLYIPIFLLGMSWAMYGHKIPKLSSLKTILALFITIGIPLILFAFIYDVKSIFRIGIPLYLLLTIGFVMLSCIFKDSNNIVKRFFCYLGVHSMNIYMVHLMFSKYWFSDAFYSINSPLLVFIALLMASLLFSVTIEWLKKICHYNQLFNKLSLKINKS